MAHSTRSIFSAVALLVLLAGAGWLFSAPGDGSRVAHMGTASDAYPRDMADQLLRSHAVVLARQESFEFAGYLKEYDSQTGQPIWVDPATPGSGGLPVMMVGPVTDMTIVVLESLYGELDPGSQVTVRLSGNVDEDLSCDPGNYTSFQWVGAEFLFFLRRQPDGVTYGLPYGNVSRLNVLGPEVADTNCPGGFIWFTDNTTPDAFMLELRELIDSF